MSKWIEFVKRDRKPDMKTDIYDIVSKDGISELGKIKWYGPWRKYSFFPNDLCVFEKQCLLDIVAFIDGLMAERKNKSVAR